ncbi:RidA family protein [Rhodococcus sp. GXMU-t2271]|uniref:Endoribonuclease L-PSP n=3 Tax=Rhodococcus TaxID=1827 RepID=A0A0N0S0R0_RHORH|nr:MULTISPECIES: RidA family protein [Rhodococcus]EME67148.1 Putative translation initiation inhibitor, yjgF family protein [Rhodococcus ruber BKS 20-38]KOS55651.1 endoribonuclease L-PSP [Rhodococcus rhodochrous KG-21]MDM7486973.1 RidA family protein [Rhodococcus indonesiensis]
MTDSIAVTHEPTAHPYSPAYAVAGFGFVSGALSVDEHGIAVDGTTAALDAAIARLGERLATIGMTLSDVVKTTYFVTDVSLRDQANRHYEKIFATPRPARSFVEVAALPYGATVEIEAVAYRA